MMNDNIDTFDFYIYPREVGAAKRILLHNLGACILDAAGLSAAKRGFGMNDMHARGLAWVVSRMRIDITELPREYESVKIKTWVSATGSVASTRLFCVESEDGRVIATASTLWSIIDTTTRKMVDLIEQTDLSRYIAEMPSGLQDIPAPRRVDMPRHEEGTSQESTHKVVYSDIDMNRHVNSMKYLQWAIDTLPAEYLMNHTPKQCHINFTHEALPGQTISIHHVAAYTDNTESDTEHTFELTNDEGRVCCRIRLIESL